MQLTTQLDLSQVATRALVEGGGGTTIADLVPGDTIMPLDTVGWYQPGGGAITTGTQRIAYASLANAGPSGIGSLVGPGVTPTTPPGISPLTGAGVDPGLHYWGYSWVTPSGESLASPVIGMATQAEPPPAGAPTTNPPVSSGGLNDPIAAPPTAVSVNNSIPSTPNAGMDFGTVDYVVTFYTASGETPPGPISNTVTVSDPNHTIVTVQNLPLGPADTTVGRKIYRRLNQTGAFYLVRDQANNLGAPLGETSFEDAVPNASVGPAAPTANTSGAGSVLNPPAAFLTVSYGGIGSPGNIETGTYDYAMTYQTAQGETTPGPISLQQATNASNGIISVTLGTSTPPAMVTGKNLYRRQNGTGVFKRTAANLPPTLTVYGDGIRRRITRTRGAGRQHGGQSLHRSRII